MAETLTVRVDAGARIGSGHLMRCLALAQAWKDQGGRVVFLITPEALGFDERLKSEGMEVVCIDAPPGSPRDSSAVADTAHREGASWVVTDGDHFTADYQRRVKESGLRLLLIDDYGHASHYYADIVLNQNLSASEGLYQKREPGTRLLLGTSYVLLRREFKAWKEWKREIQPVARKVLVTLGGCDPENATLKVVQSLLAVEEDVEVTVVIGEGNPHCRSLRSAVGRSPAIGLKRCVKDMPKLMAWADMAISAGGTTCWELAFMGLPSLTLTLTKNQISLVRELHLLGVSVDLGWHGELTREEVTSSLLELSESEDRRRQMSHQGRRLVDGQGCVRVLDHLEGSGISLRRLEKSDLELLWEWANDQEVRQASFSTDPVSWEEHVDWFNQKISSPTSVLFIVLGDQGLPIGQVRYDIVKKDAEISISIARDFRGKGYGSRSIKKASERIFAETNIQTIHAYVKSGNEMSVRAFLKAGFKEMGTAIKKGFEAKHLLCLKDEMTPNLITREKS